MTNKEGKITGLISRNEEEFIENMHNAMMGQDNFKALQARCLKNLVPVVMKWLRDERDRGTDPQELIEATSTVTFNILMSIAVSVCRKGRQEDVVGHMIVYLLQSYNMARRQGLFK